MGAVQESCALRLIQPEAHPEDLGEVVGRSYCLAARPSLDGRAQHPNSVPGKVSPSRFKQGPHFTAGIRVLQACMGTGDLQIDSS